MGSNLTRGLAASLCLAILLACGGGGGGAPDFAGEAGIVGTWMESTITVESQTKACPANIPFAGTSYSGSCEGATWIIRSDHTLRYESPIGSYNASWYLSGSRLTITDSTGSAWVTVTTGTDRMIWSQTDGMPGPVIMVLVKA